MKIIYTENDNVLALTGLQVSITDAYVNDATVTVTLEDEGGAEVPGETWPLSMVYALGSNGTYRATLSDTLTLTPGRRYTATVNVVGGDGLTGKWELHVAALRRIA